VKTFSYDLITDSTTALITSFSQLAAENPDLAHLFRQQAKGVLATWSVITEGSRKAGDLSRLVALVDGTSPGS
jgi:hypothetical protein